ncbi:MAG: nucleotidyltransferase domain-containing protein [Nanoarchaeota archaeon]|nr:nucleotidyltransferase domain-containing protein [Nanoarchaeota archaeon]
MITKKKSKVLKFLATGSHSDNYINNVARQCVISVSGAHLILNNLEDENILKHEDIGNLKSYSIDFNEKSKSLLELTYANKLDKKLENRKRELEDLKKYSKVAIVFGSYLHKKDPNDIDILFILEEKDYNKFNDKLEDIGHIVPVKIHAVLQTKIDLIKNIKKKEKIVIEALRNGKLLYGNRYLVNILENVR